MYPGHRHVAQLHADALVPGGPVALVQQLLPVFGHQLHQQPVLLLLAHGSQQCPGHTGSHIRVSGQDTAQNAALVLPPQLLRHHRDQILRNGVIVDVVYENTQF